MIIFENGLTRVEEIKENIKKINGQIFTDVAPLAQFLSKKDFNLFLSGLLIEKYLLEFKGIYIKRKRDFIEMERFRMENLLPFEINTCQEMGITYDSYIKIKKCAVMEKIDKNAGNERLSRMVKLNDCRVSLLLNFFKKMDGYKIRQM